MKAILIDAVNGRVDWLEVAHEADILETLGALFVEAETLDNGDLLFTDADSGALHGFYFQGRAYYGNGIIIGTADGELTDCKAEELYMMFNLGERF